MDESADVSRWVSDGRRNRVEWMRRGKLTPVDVAGPVDLAVHVVVGGGQRAVRLLPFLDDERHNAVAVGHGVVADGGEGSDERREDMEEPLRLYASTVSILHAPLPLRVLKLTV